MTEEVLMARRDEITAEVATHEAAADPHPQYQKESEKGAANGYASLDAGGTVPDSQIPAGIARDSEVTAAVATHEAAADPHTQYQKESEKGVANGYASLDAGATIPDSQIPASIARDSEVAASYQPLDAELTAIAGLTSAANKGIQFTGSGTAATFDLTAAGKALLDDASAADQRATLGLGSLATLNTVGTLNISSDAVTYEKIQNVTLDTILGRMTLTDGNPEEIPCTAAGRALIDDVDAAAQRTTLGLGTAATQNTGTSGAMVPLLDGINTWSANQKIESAAAGIRYFQTDEVDKNWFLVADSIFFLFQERADDDSFLRTHSTFTHGGGLRVGNPTGGDKGAGTINASAVYDDNVLLTCYVLEAELSGQVTPATWDGYTLDLEIPEEPEQVEERPVMRKVLRRQRVRDDARFVERLVEVDEPVYDEWPVVDEFGAPVLHNGAPVVERVQRTERVVTKPAQPARTEVRTHGPARRFAARAAQMLDPAQYAAAWKAAGHLPAMPSPAEWEAAGKKMSIGDMVQRLWETVEVQAVHIEKLRARIEALESSRGTP